ncbi:putative F-box domain, leucine-rich repeat domain superfamily, F-box-like domain superfamily [Helianthus annuus]|nr:putative F-box domain, leucine-rich repeat domain superfamily, F-box-like domain superfamily [Helianthus annuus]
MSSDNNVDDRLSMLPEEITLHILSLMPTKYAVRTSILSTRWRYRWMFVTNLDFDDYHPINGHDMLKNFDMLKKLVNRVLELWKTPQVELFQLHLSRTWDSRIVENWIDKAVRLNVRELDIQGLMLSLPLSFFTCKTLTKLRLNNENCHYFLWKSGCLCPVNLPCLKTLDIVAYSNPFANAFKLIAGCPMLESLSLEVTKCNSEEDLIQYPNFETTEAIIIIYRSCISYKQSCFKCPKS